MSALRARAALVAATSVALLATSAGPAAAAFTDPRPITPAGSDATWPTQATDRQGDTTLAWLAEGAVKLRILRADGSRTPVRTVGHIKEAVSVLRVAVDDDGDGVVLWDDWDAVATPLYARRVTRHGRLGDVRQVSVPGHHVHGADLAVQPRGVAVVTWARWRDSSYSPWVRMFRLDGSKGRAREVGKGPHAGPPAVDIDRNGRALLTWSNGARVYVRRLASTGRLGSTVLVHRHTDPSDNTEPAVAVDRDGDALVTWSRVGDTGEEAWGRRFSRRTQPVGQARRLSRDGEHVHGLRMAMDLQGDAVLVWATGYYEGIFARRLRRDGTLDRIQRLGSGGHGGVWLDDDGDGAVLWAGYRDGERRLIRVTRLRRGGAWGSTATVGVNGYDSTGLAIDGTPGGRLTVTWEQEPSVDDPLMVVRGR
jgi:hypothetical protein